MPKRNTPELVENVRRLASQRLTCSEIGEIVDMSAPAVQKVMKRHGIPAGNPPSAVPQRRNKSYTGGRIVDKTGYILVLTHGHPYANSGGYVREHRLVVESVIQRYLLPHEVVHHKDGNKQNNAVENLELFQNNADHLRVDLKGKVPKWTPEGFARMCAPRPHTRKLLPIESPEESATPDLS